MSAPPPPFEGSYLSWGPYISTLLIVTAHAICYSLNDNSCVGRALWKKKGAFSTFFASNTTFGPGWRFAKPHQFWAFDVLEPLCVVSSHFVGDWTLLVLHLITLCWVMVCTVMDAKLGGPPLTSAWFTWFTTWSVMLLSLAGGLGLANQARYMWRKARRGGGSGGGEGGGGGPGPQWSDEPEPCSRVSPKPLLSGPRSDSPAFASAAAGAGSGTSGISGNLADAGAPTVRLRTTGSGGFGGVGAALDGVVSAAAGGGAGGSGGAVHTIVIAAAAVGAGGGAVQLPPPSSSDRKDLAKDSTAGGEAQEDSSGDAAGRKLAEWDALSIAYLLAIEAAVIAALYLDVYYWVVMVGMQHKPLGDPSTFMYHAGNLVVALMQVLLTRLPIVSVHFQAVLAYATAYMVLACIYGSNTGVWRYGLDWHKPFGVAVIPLVPLALFASMLCWVGIALARERAARVLHTRRDAAALRRRGRQRGGSGGGAGEALAGSEHAHAAHAAVRPLPVSLPLPLSSPRGRAVPPDGVAVTDGGGGGGSIELAGSSPRPVSPWRIHSRHAHTEAD